MGCRIHFNIENVQFFVRAGVQNVQCNEFGWDSFKSKFEEFFGL